MTQLEVRNLLAPVSYYQGNELPPSEWGQLEEGDHVMIQRDGEPLRLAKVDALTQDASVVWVCLDGGRGRIAVYPDEGTCIWLPEDHCRELTPYLHAQ